MRSWRCPRLTSWRTLLTQAGLEEGLTAGPDDRPDPTKIIRNKAVHPETDRMDIQLTEEPEMMPVQFGNNLPEETSQKANHTARPDPSKDLNQMRSYRDVDLTNTR